MRRGGSSGLSLEVVHYRRLRHDKVMDKPRLTDAEITAADAQFPHHAERTWAYLGRCVSRYQESDDFIEFVFLSMWDGPIRPQMRAVYALGNRDLVTRCKVITNAIEAGPAETRYRVERFGRRPQAGGRKTCGICSRPFRHVRRGHRH